MRHEERRTIEAIGNAYLRGEDKSSCPAVREALADYEDEVDELFELLCVRVTFVDWDPYPCFSIMKKRVLRERCLEVSTRHAQHPGLSLGTNLRSRAVHDVLGHLASGADFSPLGEVEAFWGQAALHSERTRAVLFSEIAGQSAAFAVQGRFAAQKVVAFDTHEIEGTRDLRRPWAAAVGLQRLVDEGFVHSAVLDRTVSGVASSRTAALLSAARQSSVG